MLMNKNPCDPSELTEQIEVHAIPQYGTVHSSIEVHAIHQSSQNKFNWMLDECAQGMCCINILLCLECSYNTDQLVSANCCLHVLEDAGIHKCILSSMVTNLSQPTWEHPRLEDQNVSGYHHSHNKPCLYSHARWWFILTILSLMMTNLE